MADNIAIIGASYLQLPLIKKAKEMGYTTHVGLRMMWARRKRISFILLVL